MGSDREVVVAFGGVMESGSGAVVERGSGWEDLGGRGEGRCGDRRPREAELGIADCGRREWDGAKADQRSRASIVSVPNHSLTVCRAGAESRWVKRTAKHFFGLEQVT